MKEIIVEKLNASEFEIHADYDKNPAFVNFKVYKIVARSESLVFYFLESESCDEMTENVSTASVFLHGSIKWDGCANLWFIENYFHFCSQSEAGDIGRLLETLYRKAATIIGSEELKGTGN